MDASVGTARRTLTALRRVAATAIAATGLIAATAGSAAAAGEGEVNFQRTAGAQIEHRLISNPTASERAFFQEKYWRIRGFAPFYDQALGWAPESHFYQDLYAIYRDDPRDQQLMAQHPDWVLRDANGNRMFIPWGCGGGSCGQYAADIGNPAFRAYWIDMARKHFDKGYAGIFVDDVNLEMSVGNGNGERVAPMDPRTGRPMTETDWRRYMAEFTEEIRAAFPDKEIVHNSLWWMDHNDPYVQRQTQAADYVEMERGFNDGGLTGGTGQWSYSRYLAHVDWLHQQGVGVFFEPTDLTAQSAAFELASYYLGSNANDAISADYKADPSNWWSGWDTDLGDATGARYTWQSLRRRDFSGGMVLTNEPGAPTRTVQLPADRTWKDLNGNTVTSVTLGPRQAAVLTGTAAPAQGGGSTGGGTTGGGSTPPPPPPPADPAPAPTPAPAPASGTGTAPSGSQGTATAPSGSQQPSTGTQAPSSSTPAPTIKVSRTKVKRGRSVTVTGEAASSRVEIRAWIDGEWQVVSSDDTVEDGSYGVKLRTTEPGVVELKATAPGQGESSAVTIRVKG